MSKVKDYLLPSIQTYQELQLWIGYEEYSRSIDQSPTAIELDRMEQEYLAKRNSVIVAQSINNLDYQNPKGA